MGPECAGQTNAIHLVHAEFFHQEPGAGIERRLGKLYGAHVVLVNSDAGFAVDESIAEGPTVRLDARRALGELAPDRAVGVDDAGEVEFGDDLDDAGTANPGDAAFRQLFFEFRIVRPHVAADHLVTRLEGFTVDAHPLDG